MDTTISRAPAAQEAAQEVPAVKGNGEDLSTVDAPEVEPEFSIHERIKGKPYTAEYLGLGEEYAHLKGRDIKSIALIESTLREVIKARSLKDDTYTALNLISDIEQKLGISDHDPYYRLDKLAKFIEVMGLEI